MKRLLLVTNLFFSNLAMATIERIQTTRFDRSQVMRIYLAPGLGSILLFPCGLLEVFVGRSEDLKVQISPTDKKTLYLNLKQNTSLPTNVIAKCEPERNIFVFDVIPSKAKHQDVVEIRSFYGSPSNKTFKSLENSHETTKKVKHIIRKPSLIGQGGL